MKFTKEEYNKWNYDINFQLKQIEKDASNIQFIKDPSEQVCLKAVKHCRSNNHGSNIQYIKDPSEQVCLEALANNLDNIRCVDIEKHPYIYEKYELMYEFQQK